MYQEDDITASVVVPADKLENVFFREERKSLKFSQNCEFRLFQRPDDAIYRGYDKMVSRIYICTHIHAHTHTHTHTHTHFVCGCVGARGCDQMVSRHSAKSGLWSPILHTHRARALTFQSFWHTQKKQTEWDMSKPGNFISNFEPLDRQKVGEIVEDVIGFEQFTEPMQERLSSFMDQSFPKHVVSSAHPRIVDGTNAQKYSR